MNDAAFDPVEASIEETLDALESGRVTAVWLAEWSLNRIASIDRAGPRLNAVPVLNPFALDEARASDERRAAGTPRPLEGVPFTVKDSYMVEGLTVAAGSPAFTGLIARGDAFSVEKLREAGAVLIGKTNMPPMADGGMQRGAYGRAESPYNLNYLPAAYASGSSNGSGVATATSMAVFGMGEETVSSGRSPASNNGLCAYTPSWGILSIRGNWPLFPARDVVVPHTRSMLDMLRVLDVLVQDDPISRGDFWRSQQVIALPTPSEHRPRTYLDAARPDALRGKRLAVPRMYLGEDPAFPIAVRPSVRALWNGARERLEQLGAEVVETAFPLIEAYEGDRPGQENVAALGVLPDGWMDAEFNHFLAFGWDDFLRANAEGESAHLDRLDVRGGVDAWGEAAHLDRLDEQNKLDGQSRRDKKNRVDVRGGGGPRSLAEVDADLIFPTPPGTLPDRYEEVEDYPNRYRAVVGLAAEGIADPRSRDDFAVGLHALVALRESLFEAWLDEHGFDAIVFPANADVARESAEREVVAADHAWSNGVFFSNGNYAIRHLGIPTVTVTMGAMADIGMPVGLTFAGRAYDDVALLSYGYAFEVGGPPLRPVPQL